MACKIYVETSVVICASLGIMLGGKPVKHDHYDNTYNLLQFAEMQYSQGADSFFTASTVVTESRRVLEKALNDLLEKKLRKLQKKGKQARVVNAERFYLLLSDCTDQLDVWISYLKLENFDSRKKDEIMGRLREEFRNLDVEFRKENPMDINHFGMSTLNRGLKRVARAVWTGQRKQSLEEYKPNPGRIDIETMAEIACINMGQDNEVYVVSEDRHFYSKKSRALLERLYRLKTRRSYEMLQGGFISTLLKCG